MTQKGIGSAIKDCSSWYFLGMFIWIGIIIFLILFAGGFGEVPLEFTIIILLFFTIIGLSALILFSIRTFRQPPNPTNHSRHITHWRKLQPISTRKKNNYRNNRGDETIRRIAPLSLGHQYFTGYCYLRNELRTFKNSRLKQITLTTSYIDKTAIFC